MVSTTTATILLTGTVVALAIQGPMTEYLWLLILGFIVAFILAFAVGANDVANSFGTAVGSGVVTLKQGCILASVFETLGCVFIGAKVGDTIRKGIIDVNVYHGSEIMLMAGSFSAMVGSAVWHLVASFFKLPISGTHSIVGATIGFSLVAKGLKGVNWLKLLLIVVSWFLSPLLSGIASGIIFYIVRRFILQKEDPVPNGLKALPVFYAFTMGVNVFSILFTGAPMLGFDKIPWWGDLIVSLGSAGLTAVLVWFLVCPYLKRKIELSAKPQPVPEERRVVFDIGDSDDTDHDASNSFPHQAAVNKQFQDSDGQTDTPNQAQFNNMPVYLPSNSYSQYHTVHKDSDLHRELMRHKNSYTAYAMAITGMHSELKHKEGVFRACDEGDEGPGSGGLDRKLPCVENCAIYSNGPAPSSPLALHDVTLEMVKEDDDNKLEKDRPEVATLFQFLQIITACFEAFAHGGNDVSNAVGPLVALWIVYSTGSVVSKASTPVWLLFYGGAGIAVGLCVWGRRVMQTMGRDLTPITPSSGFSIELASALTVLFASNIGLPVSTTHCQVGSVVAVGWLRSRMAVDWRLFRNIFLAWLFTVPITGLISAAIMALFIHVIL